MVDEESLLLWREKAPWVSPSQVKQDLIISRALIDIYSHPVLQKTLAFRGGTALQKIFYSTPTRYSEDIDMVQIEEGGIGPILDGLRVT